MKTKQAVKMTSIVTDSPGQNPLIAVRDNKLTIMASDPELEISIVSKGHVTMDCKSLSILVDEDFSVDSKRPDHVPSIFLNSRMARQVRDMPESLAYRESQYDKAMNALSYAWHVLEVE